MVYNQQMNSRFPGCIIILLDQSFSMDTPFGYQQEGAGERKCDKVATVLNDFLNVLITSNTDIDSRGQPQTKPRADIAILGYKGSSVNSALKGKLSSRKFVSLPELQMNPIANEQRRQTEIDETGTIIEYMIDFSIWVKPEAGGGTPMCAALSRAVALAEEWVHNFPTCYPPVIINVTDGAVTDGDPKPIADKLRRISTRDGQALLYTVHITDINLAPVEYPAKASELPNDEYTQMLFSISSEIPEKGCEMFASLLQRTIEVGSRGLIFNGDAASIRLMFDFASLPATQPM
jgi:hypothetical protein